MKGKSWLFILLTGLLVGLIGAQAATAKDWAGVLICGDTPGLKGAGDDSVTWNNGIGQEKGFDEFWNDTFLMWELLYQFGYDDENIHVLFKKGHLRIAKKR